MGLISIHSAMSSSSISTSCISGHIQCRALIGTQARSLCGLLGLLRTLLRFVKLTIRAEVKLKLNGRVGPIEGDASPAEDVHLR